MHVKVCLSKIVKSVSQVMKKNFDTDLHEVECKIIMLTILKSYKKIDVLTENLQPSLV